MSGPPSPRYEAIIGLECHAQLRTRSKMFCRCPVVADAPANTAICPICMGHPGTLPVLNDQAVRLGLRLSRALGATVHPVSIFARKHYFYPDLPKGYQISQYDRPLATAGTIHARVKGAIRSFGITRLHLEEDAGKMVHGEGGTVVDWNRAGTPLVEIVGEPDIRSPEEAEAWLRSLHRVLVESGVCEGDLEKGHFRCDANISVHRPGTPWGTRAEIKNVNSFRFVAKALQYEIQRQVEILEAGGRVALETRTWAGNRTELLRRKEGAADYRYFPEPDLPPLVLGPEEDQEEVAHLAGVPLDLWLLDRDDAALARWERDYGLDAYVVGVLSADADVATFFQDAVAKGGEPRLMANWIQKDLLRLLKEGPPLHESGLRPFHLVDLQGLVDRGVIAMPVARQLFEEIHAQGGDPVSMVQERGLQRVSDASALQSLVESLVNANPEALRRYLAGNRNMVGFFVGQVMKATQGQADPQVAGQVVIQVLGSHSG